MSNLNAQAGENPEHNVFAGISFRLGEDKLFEQFLSSLDVSPHTRDALVFDVRKLAAWFGQVNSEPWDTNRVMVRDVMDFREYLRAERKQEISSINRILASVKRYFKWLQANGHIVVSPAMGIRELKKQPIAPQGLSRSDTRKLLREVELRQDVRAKALFTLILYTGARLNDAVQLELSDLILAERSGTMIFRHGKGSKQRTVPLPLQARKALAEYLEARPNTESQRVFIGERGQLNSRGIQSIFEKYKALTGIGNLHPHILRHTFAHAFLQQQGNIVQLAQILGHENLNTTAIYTRNTMQELSDAVDRLTY